MSERFNSGILILLVVVLAAFICAAILLGASCGPEIPELEVEADFITVGFEDHSTMELTKGSPEFKETNDEAIRIYQNICGIYEELVPPEYIEEIKYDNKFVEIELIEPVSVTTYTDEGEVYRIFELTAAIFVFTGKYGFAGCVLNGPPPTSEWSDWGVYWSTRSFGNLEKMVDALLS
jgi:hypothetical protein